MPGLILSLMLESESEERIGEVTRALVGSVLPIKETLFELRSLTSDELQARLSNLESLPFPQRVGVKRLLFEYGINLSSALPKEPRAKV